LSGPSTPTEIVLDFIDAWEKGEWGRFPDLLADDVVFHMLPLPPAKGIEAATEEFVKMDRLGTVEIRVLAIAAEGDVVFTERIDALILPDRVGELPVVGVTEVKDGKIVAWRDYFDLQQALAAFGLAEVI
jgi:limonene-1,2-epoxide hydrolase